MAKKKRYEVYIYDPDDTESDKTLELAPTEQKLRIRLEKKNRGGKMVTVIAGYSGMGISELAKKLKSFCGVGGSVKEDEIILQGDLKTRIIPFLKDLGFRDTK